VITARSFLPLVALAVGACANAPRAEAPAGALRAAAAVTAPQSLTGTRWIGVVEGNPDPRTLPRLEFVTSERVAGYTGCNMMSGGWRTEGGTIRVGPLVSTKRACVGPENEIERRVVAALAGTVKREGDRLVFTGAGGERFEFMPARAS
jgi:heat shock protein HslJ